MWEYVVAAWSQQSIADALLSARPGGIVRVDRPDALRVVRREQAKDCEGCGAPLKAHIRHCEYCRREK